MVTGSRLVFKSRVKMWLEKRGYSVIANADNHGPIDLVAMSATENLLIRCNLDRKISKAEETEGIRLRSMFPIMNVLFAMPTRLSRRIQIKYPWGTSVLVSKGETFIDSRAARKICRPKVSALSKFGKKIRAATKKLEKEGFRFEGFPHAFSSSSQSSPCKGDVITARPRAQVDSVPSFKNTRSRMVLLSKKTAKTLGIRPGHYMRVFPRYGVVELLKVVER